MQKFLFLLPVWAHLLAMAGTFGATVTCAFLSRRDPENQDDIVWRIPQMFLGLTFLTGLALVYLRFTSAMNTGTELGIHFWGLTSCKLALLFISGALSGIASKKSKAGQASSFLWVGAASMFAAASLLGLSV